MKSLLERLDFLNDNMGSAIYEDADTCGEAAAELRRLHALNQELLEALKDLIEEFDWHDPRIEKARATIAKAESKKKTPGSCEPRGNPSRRHP